MVRDLELKRPEDKSSLLEMTGFDLQVFVFRCIQVGVLHCLLFRGNLELYQLSTLVFTFIYFSGKFS